VFDVFACYTATEFVIIDNARLPAPGVSTSQQQPSQFSAVLAQAIPPPDGAHDFDFLIGNWNAHVRRLRDRLVVP